MKNYLEFQLENDYYEARVISNPIFTVFNFVIITNYNKNFENTKTLSFFFRTNTWAWNFIMEIAFMACSYIKRIT